MFCPGSRTCTKQGAGGLTDCTSPGPSAEVCNELDDNCDGTTDEKTCDDKNLCTADTCSPAASEADKSGCVHVNESLKCDDEDPCTDKDKCVAGKCAGLPSKELCECFVDADCKDLNKGDLCLGQWVCDLGDNQCKQSVAPIKCVDTDDPCTTSSCQKGTGKCATVLQTDGLACKDGDKCTISATCKGGKCGAVASCECAKTSDCSHKDDGNPCTGEHFCHQPTANPLDWKCAINPASKVNCNETGDTDCRKNRCDKATAKCAVVNLPVGAKCDDGSDCTKSDGCGIGPDGLGMCHGGVSVCMCATDSDCSKWEDGKVCNGTMFCNKAAAGGTGAKCEVNPASVIVCPTAQDTACLQHTCDNIKGGCIGVPLADGVTCNDDNKCTVGETCSKGTCAASPNANVCACAKDEDCAKQEDGDACNGTLFCNKQTGKCTVNQATLVTCQTVDNTLCRANVCQPKTGKCAPVPVNPAFPCDDGNPCSTSDACTGLACVGKATCDCTKDSDCASKGDGNACNGTLFCSGVMLKCEINPASIIKCPALNEPCKTNRCDPKALGVGVGKCKAVPSRIGHACDDGNKCTALDFCKPSGLCEGTQDKLLCPCTKDAECDDGKLCTVNRCVAGAGCVTKSFDVLCADGNPCTDDSCAPGAPGAANTGPDADGCAHKPAQQGAPCDDGESCTGDLKNPTAKNSDTCDGQGSCVGKDLCGACKTDADCVDVAKADLCAATKVCVGASAGNAGVCQTKPGSAVVCPPSQQPCQSHRCDAHTGKCELGPAPGTDNQTCDDGSDCTTTSACQAGACVGKSTCGCTQDADCAAKEDGDACNGTLKCAPDGGVGGVGGGAGGTGGKSCQLDPLTIVSCDGRKDLPCVKIRCTPTTGKCAPTFLLGGEACDDGNPCTGSATQPDGCKNGACAGGPNQCVCQDDKACLAKDDGNACTGTLACIGFKCVVKPNTAVLCGGAVGPCERLLCDSKLAKCVKTAAHDGWACDDGEKCTSGDHCSAGSCVATSKVAGCCPNDAFCNDGVTCTKDTCDPGTKDKPGKGCLNAPVNTACADGNVCTKNTCAPLQPQAGVWDAVSGCLAVSATDGAVCDDGDACTGLSGGPDGCAVGLCKAGTVVVCDDGDACTTDACDAKAGCKTAPVTCEDDGNPCTAVACEKASGCVTGALKDGTACKIDGADGTCELSVCIKTPPSVASNDLDHDGLGGTDDPCPTVWNPDGDAKACPAFDGKGWASSVSAGLGEPGQPAGMSKARRTNEPVELPLVNGLLDSSVVGYWRLDGDFAAPGINAKPAFEGAPQPGVGAFGGASGAMTFDGKSGAQLWSDRAALFAGPYTVAVWARVDAKARATLVQATSGTKCADQGPLLQWHETGVLRSEVIWAGTSGAVLKTPMAHDGKWHHVAMTWDGQRVAQYIDGRRTGEALATTGTAKDCGNALSVGYSAHNSGSKTAYLQGALDELLVFGRALSPTEIATYVASKAPYASSYVPGAQADFDDIRVGETTDAQVGEHLTHIELSGVRRHSDTDLTDVVAYWPLDGDAKDVTGKHPLTDVQGETVAGRFGDKDGALDMTKATIGARAKTLGATPMQTGTWEFWTRLDDCQPEQYFVHAATSFGTATARFYFYVAGCKLVIAHGTGMSGVPLTAKNWTHLGLTWDDKTVKLYIDGVVAKQGAATGPLQAGNIAASHFQLGGGFKAANTLRGRMDEVLLHSVPKSADYFANRALGLPRVRFLAHTREKAENSGLFATHGYKLWWGNKTANAVGTRVVGLDKKATCDGLLSPCLGYAGWWRLDDGRGALAVDESTWRRNGTVTAVAWHQAVAGTLAAELDSNGGIDLPLSDFRNDEDHCVEVLLRADLNKSPTHILDQLGTYGWRWSWVVVQPQYVTSGPVGGALSVDAPITTGTMVQYRFQLQAATGQLSFFEDDALKRSHKLGNRIGHANRPLKVRLAKGRVGALRVLSRSPGSDEALHYPLLAESGRKAVAPVVPVVPTPCASGACSAGSCAQANLVTTFAGTGVNGTKDGPRGGAEFSAPYSVAADSHGNVYIGDVGGNTIRRIAPDGTVATLTATGFESSPVAPQMIMGPYGLHVGPDDTLYIYSSKAHVLYRVAPGLGPKQWTAGPNSKASVKDGPLATAEHGTAYGIAAQADGKVYFADYWVHRIRFIHNGYMRTLVGSSYGFVDGPAATARFYFPHGIVLDATGRLFVADKLNHAIRRVTPTGTVTTIVGNGSPGGTDGTASAARLYNPAGIVRDAAGALFVSETTNAHRVRRIGLDGTVTTVAGGTQGFADGLGTAARFDLPFDIALSVDGALLVADAVNKRIRAIAIEANLCDDKNPCTVDACDGTKGCTNLAIKDCALAKDMDLDHDGLVGTQDACPTAWSPDNDASVCAPTDTKSLPTARALEISEDGLDPGFSQQRRTNEPVEIPLVNGVLDGSIIASRLLASATEGQITTGKPLPTDGVFAGDKALSFDGKSGLQVDQNTPVGAAFTYSFWMRYDDEPVGEHMLISTTRDAAVAKCDHRGVIIRLDGAVGFQVKDASGVRHASAPLPASGTWHHVAAVADNGQVSVYVNGLLGGSGKGVMWGVPLDCPNKVRVGYEYTPAENATTHMYTGRLARLLVLNRALSPQEVAFYYNSGQPYGTNLVPGAQPDYDDVRITEKTDVQPAEHGTHFELLGARPHSDTDLDGVIAYMKFDGTGGEPKAKHQVNKLSTVATVGRFGDKDGALLFDGKKSAVSVLDTGDLNTAAGTWELWFRKDKCLGRTYMFRQQKHDGVRQMLSVYACEFVELSREQSGDGKQAFAKVNVPIKLGHWHHIGVVWANGIYTVYFDGTPVASDSGWAQSSPGGDIWIGNTKDHAVTPDYALAGAIDEVLIHNVARSEDYFANRARGLPRLRFLAHTRAHPEFGVYRLHDYTMRWGDKAAKTPKTRVVALDGKTTCDALLSPCLGYVGFWRFDDALLGWDSSSAREHLIAGGDATAGAGQSMGALAVSGNGWLSHNVAVRPPHYTIEATVFAADLKTYRGVLSMGGKPGTGAMAIKQTTGEHLLEYRDGSEHTLAGPNVVANTWTQLASGYDGTHAHIWTQGQAGAPLKLSPHTSSGKGLYVGGLLSPSSGDVFAHMNGRIDNVRISNRLLAPDEQLKVRQLRVELGASIVAAP